MSDATLGAGGSTPPAVGGEIRFRVLDEGGSSHELTCIAYDGDHRIRSVSLDSCDKDGWPVHMNR